MYGEIENIYVLILYMRWYVIERIRLNIWLYILEVVVVVVNLRNFERMNICKVISL